MLAPVFAETHTLIQPAPIHTHYMLLPVDQGFNWDECFGMVNSGQWYLVVFRSKHLPNADEALLTALDNGASAATICVCTWRRNSSGRAIKANGSRLPPVPTMVTVP